MVKILVLTASAGEPQLASNQQSVRRQVGVEVDQIVLEGLGYVEAHRVIAAESHQACARYDWVAKLDGDMVFADPSSLARLADAARPSDGRVATPVADAYSGRSIMGFHLYRPELVPAEADVDALHSDSWLSAIPASTKRFRTPLVDHAPNPNTAQAVRYGLQRGLKAVAEGPLSNHWWVMQGAARLARASRGESAIPRAALASFMAGLGVLSTSVGEPTAAWLNQSSADFGRLTEEITSLVKRSDDPRVVGRRFWRSHADTYGSFAWAVSAALRCEAITARARARRGRLPA